MKLIAMLSLMAGMATFAFGASVPEIDANSASGAIALLSGAVLMFRARRKK